jgi:hypothetical protein
MRARARPARARPARARPARARPARARPGRGRCIFRLLTCYDALVGASEQAPTGELRLATCAGRKIACTYSPDRRVPGGDAFTSGGSDRRGEREDLHPRARRDHRCESGQVHAPHDRCVGARAPRPRANMSRGVGRGWNHRQLAPRREHVGARWLGGPGISSRLRGQRQEGRAEQRVGHDGAGRGGLVAEGDRVPQGWPRPDSRADTLDAHRRSASRRRRARRPLRAGADLDRPQSLAGLRQAPRGPWSVGV